MSCWNKEELENMLEDVVNELDLSDGMIETHGPLGTAPAELVRLVLERKDLEIKLLKRGFVEVGESLPYHPQTLTYHERLEAEYQARGTLDEEKET